MGAVYALAPLPDGRLLSGSADSTLKVWDVLVRDRDDVLLASGTLGARDSTFGVARPQSIERGRGWFSTC